MNGKVKPPCAPRAVILPAVQSLRRSCSEGACWESVMPFQGWESFFVGTRGDAPVYHIAPL
jgi:hypothetical protein